MRGARVQPRPDGMDLVSPRRRLTERSLPAILAGLIVGAAMLTPAVSGAAAFLTKKKADKRYLGNTTIVTSTSNIPAESAAALTVTCPAGRQATDGGADSPFFVASPLSMEGVVLTESKPVMTGARATGWYVELFTGTGTTYSATVYAVCAP
jgi:hypothetical protein